MGECWQLVVMTLRVTGEAVQMDKKPAELQRVVLYTAASRITSHDTTPCRLAMQVPQAASHMPHQLPTICLMDLQAVPRLHQRPAWSAALPEAHSRQLG
jgi:hypothetical protein